MQAGGFILADKKGEGFGVRLLAFMCGLSQGYCSM